MKRLILTALSLFLLLPAVSAEDRGKNDVPYFTNQDLEKYKYGPSHKIPEDSKAPDSSDSSAESRGEKLRQFAVPYNPYEGTARRIIIPVTFNGRVTAPMLLDTGAPGMHISYRLAEKLGVIDDDESSLWINMAGIGGSAPAIYTIIDRIQVGEAEDHFIPTTVSRSMSDYFDGLIGMDFMAGYSVRIDTRKHVVVFEELPSSPYMPAGHDETWWRITFLNFASMKSVWENQREYLNGLDNNSDMLRRMRKFADRQYREADTLYTRLRVYASENAVPLEWRKTKIKDFKQ